MCDNVCVCVWLCGHATLVSKSPVALDSDVMQISNSSDAASCCASCQTYAKLCTSSSNTLRRQASKDSDIKWQRTWKQRARTFPPLFSEQNNVSEGGKLFHLTSGEIIAECPKYARVWLRSYYSAHRVALSGCNITDTDTVVAAEWCFPSNAYTSVPLTLMETLTVTTALTAGQVFNALSS